MATIHTSDTIMASATRLGKTLATINATGFTSYADVIKHLRSQTNGIVGMISVRLRNFSQGWSEERNIYVTSQAIS